MTPCNTLLKAVQDAHVFRKNRRPIGSKILACLLYLAGLSYRGMTYQTRVIEASHVSVYRWVHALKRIVSLVPQKERKVVAIDETMLKIKGRQVFVWAAIDTDTRELLAVYASYYRSNINTLVFLKRVLSACTNRPVVLVDGGPMVPVASREVRAEVAPHNLRGEELHRTVLQDNEGEVEKVLQQPPVGKAGQPGVLLERLHAVVQPSEEASKTQKDTIGGVIVTVSGREGEGRPDDAREPNQPEEGPPVLWVLKEFVLQPRADPSRNRARPVRGRCCAEDRPPAALLRHEADDRDALQGAREAREQEAGAEGLPGPGLDRTLEEEERDNPLNHEDSQGYEALRSAGGRPHLYLARDRYVVIPLQHPGRLPEGVTSVRLRHLGSEGGRDNLGEQHSRFPPSGGHEGSHVELRQRLAVQERGVQGIVEAWVRVEFIYADTPEQNGHVESFHKTLKRECLWPRDFRSHQEPEMAIADAFRDYNLGRIHSSLRYRTPYEFLEE